MVRATPEGRVKKRVKETLSKHGAWFYMPVQTGYGRAGVPDFVVCLNGRFVAIETKATSADKLTPLQDLCLKSIRNAGGVALVVTACNADNLMTLIQEELNR